MESSARLGGGVSGNTESLEIGYWVALKCHDGTKGECEGWKDQLGISISLDCARECSKNRTMCYGADGVVRPMSGQQAPEPTDNNFFFGGQSLPVPSSPLSTKGRGHTQLCLVSGGVLGPSLVCWLLDAYWWCA